MKTVSTAEMKAIDEKAIRDFGIPSLELMENAASCVTNAVLEEIADLSQPAVIVICGTGNNGGDGLVCARQLAERKIPTSVFLVGNSEKQTPDSRINQQRLAERNIPVIAYTGQNLPECSVVVDALFGFGLNREVHGSYRDVIEKINSSGAKVIACDIPSGLNGDSGAVMGVAVRASRTVCFTCAKTGLLEESAAPYVGVLQVVDIGIPSSLLEA